MANYLSEDKRKQIFHLLCEGNGVRSIQRIVGCSKQSIASLQTRFLGIVNHLSSIYVKDLDIEEIEADEIRTFVGNKTNLRWIYIALDKKSRMVLHYHVGKRDTNDARKFLIGLSEKLNSTSKVSTDCLKSYVSAIANHPTNADTLSQTEAIDLLRSKQIGRKLGRAITNKIEAHNGNVRQHISRLIRRTRCFSKKDSGLNEHLALFFFYYNFIKIHKVLRGTPAMSAELVDKPITLDHLMEYDAILTGQPTLSNSPKLNKEERTTTTDERTNQFRKEIEFLSMINKRLLDEKKNNPERVNKYEERISQLEKENNELFVENKIAKAMNEFKMEDGLTAAQIGKLGGLKGGPARAAKLSPERRREIAQKAALARWGNKELVGSL